MQRSEVERAIIGEVLYAMRESKLFEGRLDYAVWMKAIDIDGFKFIPIPISDVENLKQLLSVSAKLFDEILRTKFVDAED